VTGRASLSVFCRSAAAGPRPAALLATLRGVADEIVVAVDSRADPESHRDLLRVADRVVTYEFAEPYDRPLPWLFEQCRGDWALSIDDDEIPSLELIEALPELCADERLVHYSLPRRWLFPDASTYLDDWPWRPDYALRLLRRDPRLIRFSDEFHRSILAAGPGRFLTLPLWHVDPIVRPVEERRAKARLYERRRPGMRIAGRSHNYAFYLPENRPDPPLAPLPDAEREHVEAIVRAGPQPGPPRATVEPVAGVELDRLWPVTDPAARAGRLELLEREPEELIAGERRTVEVLVRNDGSATWPWGVDGVPEIRVGSRWFDPNGRELEELQIHSVLAGPLPPGDAEVVPAHVVVPGEAGAYRLRLELLHQHVGWFGVALELDVDVRPQRRVVVIGDDDAVTEVAGILEELPELELVRLRRTPSRGPEGYPEVADGRAYLFDGAPAGRYGFAASTFWRGLRLRLGPPPPTVEELVATLRGAEMLVVAGLDGPDQKRERWAVGLVERRARRLGVPVAHTRDRGELLRLFR
jgi:hypothetical protein